MHQQPNNVPMPVWQAEGFSSEETYWQAQSYQYETNEVSQAELDYGDFLEADVKDQRQAEARFHHLKTRLEDAKDYAVEFPNHVMKGSMGDFARLHSDGSECPYEFAFMAGLTAFGAVVAHKLQLVKDGLKVRSNLYTVLLGPTGCKKSTALRYADDLLKATGHLTTLKDNGNGFMLPALLFPGTGSGEGIAKLFKHGYDRILLSIDEFQSALAKARIENSTLGPLLTTLFDSTDAANAVSKETLSVTGKHLSLYGAITTASWDGIWSKGTERELGLLNTLFLVSGVPRDKVLFPNKPDADKYNMLVERVRKQIEKAGPLAMSDEANAQFNNWYEDLDITQEESVRLDSFGKKIALVLAATMDKAEIDLEVAKSTVDLLHYQLKVRKLLAPSAAQNAQAAMEQKIQKALERWEMQNPGEYIGFGRLADRTKARQTQGIHMLQRALMAMLQSNLVQVSPDKNRNGQQTFRLPPQE
jgi:hypothetical protein